MKEHIMNILKEVAIEGAVNGKEYLEKKAEQIMTYLPQEEYEEKKKK